MHHRKTDGMILSASTLVVPRAHLADQPHAPARPFAFVGGRLIVLGAVLAISMVLAGCRPQPSVPPTAAPSTPSAVPVADPAETVDAPAQTTEEAPAKGTPDNPLTQLLVPSGKVDQVLAGAQRLDELMAARGFATDSSVAVSYAAAIDALCSGQADVVWMAPLSYVVAKDRCPEVQLLFSSLRFGSKAYTGQILVRAGSGIERLEDLAGKTIAFTDPASASGYLYPIALLASHGVQPGRGYFAGSHLAAALAVVRGEADAAATVADIRDEMEQDLSDIKDTTRVLAQTEPIPNDAVVASSTLSPEIVEAYKKAFLDVTSGNEGEEALRAIYGWEGVVDGDDAMFEPVRQAIATLGIDPQDWKGVTRPYRVGLVTGIGNAQDGTLNQAAYEGMMRAAADFNVETGLIETVQAGDFERNVELFARQGYDLVVTVGPELADAARTVAEKYPGTRVAIVDDALEQAPANLKSLTFREDEAGFLAGALAGLMSKTRTVGLVAGEETLATRQFLTAYENGVACVCPGCDVISRFVDGASDPIQGTTAALGLIGEAADVVTGIGGPVGVGAIRGAAQDGAWAIGAEVDQYVTAFESGQVAGANRLLSSALKRGDEVVYDAIKSLVGGSLAAGTTVYGVETGGIGLASFHEAEADITDEVKATLEQIETALAQRTLTTGVDLSTGELLAGAAPEPGACLLKIDSATPVAP